MIDTIKNIQFDEKGLVPAIVQDATTGRVLMLAYMNEPSLLKTIETKETWFFSRSRQELWNKGATSGNKQRVEKIQLDCDQDSLLIEVSPLGPACHTGKESCFYSTIFEESEQHREIIHELVNKINERYNEPLEGAYTTYLFNEGLDKVLKKIGEEASEVIIGAKNEDKEELTWELADFIYHALVLMQLTDISITDIKKELANRHVQREAETDE